jgi:hypothetical protein
VAIYLTNPDILDDGNGAKIPVYILKPMGLKFYRIIGPKLVEVGVFFFLIGQPSFPGNRIGPYPSLLGRSHCSCWPQSLNGS